MAGIQPLVEFPQSDFKVQLLHLGMISFYNFEMDLE
jgi:hypothetical protein